MRVHTCEKPFKCRVCDMAFSQLGNLNRHMRVDMGDKRYKCHVCDKAFGLAGNINIHMRVPESPKALLHTLHLNGLSPMWTLK